MSKGPDENDRLRAGTLPKDPSADTERMRPAREKSRVIELGAEPCDLRAEKALLGALLWAGAHQPEILRIAQVLDILETGEPFYGRGHTDLFDAMVAIAGEHDPVATHAELIRRGHLGLSFDDIAALKDDASTVSERQARVYALSIRTAWARRCAIRDARLLADAAHDPKVTADDLLQRGHQAITEMAQRVSASGRSVSVGQSADTFFKALAEKKSQAMPTGLRDLDMALNGGLRPGEVSIIGARTNVGKSMLSAQIGEHMVTADASLGVLYVTLEMLHIMFTARLVSAKSGVPISNLRRMVLNPIQWTQVTEAVRLLAGKGLYFADNPSQTMGAIYAAATERSRMLAREGKRLGLVVIDHLGLVKPTAEALKKASREQQVAETSRGQRLIASELGVHVLGIAQIGRDAEKGDSNAMPRLSHLRESGSIEQDADVVMILHRARDAKTGLFDRNKPPALAIAKGRMDETAIMLLGYEPARAKFMDWNGPEKFGDIYR